MSPFEMRKLMLKIRDVYAVRDYVNCYILWQAVIYQIRSHKSSNGLYY